MQQREGAQECHGGLKQPILNLHVRFGLEEPCVMKLEHAGLGHGGPR